MQIIEDNSYSVLILAGGRLNHKIIGPAPSLNQHPVALVDGSGYALIHTAQRLRANNEPSTIYVVTDTLIKDTPPMACSSYWEWIVIEPQDSIIGTLMRALEQITDENLLVIPITTLPPQQIPPGEWIGFSKYPLPRENWSSVKDPSSPNPVFFDKFKCNATEEASHAFTGIIKTKRNFLIEAINSLKSSKLENYDLIYVAKFLWANKSSGIELIDWLDLGHLATYSKRRLTKLESRDFNYIEYDRDRDIIRKSSRNLSALLGEIDYIASLPESCKRYFPRILKISNKEDINCWVEYEYIPFPNMAELFLHWDIGPNAWAQLIDRLAVILKSLKEENKPTFEQTKSDVRWLYSEKMDLRLNKLKKYPPTLDSTFADINWNEWWGNPYTIEIINSSGSKTFNKIRLNSALNDTQSLLTDLKPLEETVYLEKIHGDFCFNNILADPITGVVRLIDPRGERPNTLHPIGFGDARYDIIKLLHSSKYLYDAIVNNMFSLTCSNKIIYLCLKIPSHYDTVNTQIEQKIIKKNLSNDEERLLTSSLFFSMLDIHKESSLRCMALTCIGQLIYSGNFSNALRSFKSIP